MTKKSNRLFLIIGSLVIIGLFAYANFLIGTKGDNKQNVNDQVQDPVALTEEAPQSAGDFYSVFKQDRNNVREKELEYLDTIAVDEETDDDTRTQAQQQKLELVSAMEKEVTIEGLLKAKGFTNVAVTMQKGSVNVIVDSPELDDALVAQVLDIVTQESGEPAQNVKIIPRS